MFHLCFKDIPFFKFLSMVRSLFKFRVGNIYGIGRLNCFEFGCAQPIYGFIFTKEQNITSSWD